MDKKAEELDELGLLKNELMEYDKNVDFYYTNLINSLILYTYNSIELESLAPILIDPLTELYEELDYAFLPVCFETVFRNAKIDIEFKEQLLRFKNQVDEIPNEIWDYEFIDNHEKWFEVKMSAEKILTNIGIQHRLFDGKHHQVLDMNDNVIYQKPDTNEK
ncbi:hypothetical protein [Myroides marinus]|uniref:hypothetical protein n=1 Tax=Myroides marinus TaxID=703342 RepID=UPI002576F9E4|nr:hypothetical protein [Myroides marinus]MDM1373822.1 hypothetical protein [Myroides marinus]